MVYSFSIIEASNIREMIRCPWRYKTVNQIREEFVRRVLSNEKSKSALCREYGISRPTADKWIKRYLSGEPLDNRSKKPFKTANRIQ